MKLISFEGGRINGAPPAFTVDEMSHAVKVARTKIVIAVPGAIEKTRRAAESADIFAAKVLLSHGAVDDFVAIQELIERGAEMPPREPWKLPEGKTNKDVCGFLDFSSGTTGLPKAVMLSHHNMVAAYYVRRQVQADPKRLKLLAIMPLYHVTGTLRFMLYPILMNGDAVMLPKFSMPAMLRATVDFQIEELVLVPPILLKLAGDPIVEQYDLRHVKRLTSGAAPISSEILHALSQRFPQASFYNGYGATEAPLMTSLAPTLQEWKNATSVGFLCANTTGKVIDEAGHLLGPGEIGELCVKGPQVALGYLDNDAATAESFSPDGFYPTGDAGYVDSEGFLYITDRIKGMIKVKGHQVPPAELEDLLLSHESIADCAVVGIKDPYAGELPKAFVVLKAGVERSH